jgi:hypothetical protein
MEHLTGKSETFGYTGQVKDPRITQLEVAGYKFDIVSCCFLKKDEWGLMQSINSSDLVNMSCQELAEKLRREHHVKEKEEPQGR